MCPWGRGLLVARQRLSSRKRAGAVLGNLAGGELRPKGELTNHACLHLSHQRLVDLKVVLILMMIISKHICM